MKKQINYISEFCAKRDVSKKATGLLVTLEKELSKSSQNNKKILKTIDLLIKENVYPSKPTPVMIKYNYSYYKMVESWGVLWSFYEDPLFCKNCGADLRNLKDGPPFKREIGFYSQSEDATIYFLCPDCENRII
jgi:predicted nucleic acid-binding Zn ribbon protein